MLVKILKAFRFAPDCRTSLELTPDMIVEIPGELIAGLHAGAYIDDADPAEIEAAAEGPVVLAAPVEIPADYAGLSWIKLKPLADAVNGGPVKDRKTGIAILAAELAARADA